jgi:hypothetical protein
VQLSLREIVIPRTEACALLLALIIIPEAWASIGGMLDFSEETIYRVTITTSLKISANSNISRVRISQGLLAERPWSKGESNSSGRNIHFDPSGGKIEHDRKSGATFIEWEERVSKNGGPMVFTTTYETISVTRELSLGASEKSRWKSRRVQAAKTMNSEIVQQSETLIKEPSPLGAFRKFSQWLNGRIRYDATISITGVDDALANGGGHCGDYVRIFLQFADAIGIRSRPIGGSNLNDKDGGADKPGLWIKPIWSNTHTWAELDIPGTSGKRNEEHGSLKT